jgi:ATP-dependent Clp protease protease subunit
MLTMPGKVSDLLKQRRIMLFGTVSAESAQAVCSQALYLGSYNREPVTLYINSPGGSVSDGLAMLDCLHGACSEVWTVATGRAASMGAVLLAAGTPGRRYVSPNATIMLHQVAGLCGGSAPDIHRQHTELQRVNDHMVNLLARYTGKDPEQVKRDIDRDLYLTPEQAIEYGIADHVTQ